MRMKVVERLLPGPGLRMQTGVEHQAQSTIQLGEQRAESRLGIAIYPQLLAERGGVQTPPLDERRGAAKPAKPRKVDPLSLQLELIVMAGHGLTQILRWQNQGGARSAHRRVDVKHGGHHAVWRTRQI